MYKIICVDYENKLTKDIADIAYIDRAKILCSAVALNYVLSKERLNYLDKKITDKHSVKKGYFLITKEQPFFMKVTVYYKQPNGVFYTGQLIKMRQYVVVAANLTKLEARVSEFEYQLAFEEVLIELIDKTPRYDFETEIITDP